MNGVAEYLRVTDLHAFYGESHILHGMDFRVNRGECVTLLGRNGAGRTTTLKAILGLTGRRTGSVMLNGREVISWPAHRIAHLGVGYCPEERGIYASLSAEENLMLPPQVASGGMAVDEIYAMFPNLGERRKSQGSRLSGGEQQMLAVGRALMSRPKLVMIDEPSLGLAPLIVDEVYALLASLKSAGVTLLIVEQNTRVALDVADYGYVMENGRIVLEGAASDLKANEDVREFYLGLNLEGERKSYRDVKHYRRRKRWLG